MIEALENMTKTINDFIKNRKLMMEMNWPFDFVSAPQSFEVSDGVAVISISGVLVKNSEFVGDFEQVSYTAIETEIAKVMENPNIDTVILDINSPGGDVNGLFELCNYILECGKEKRFIAFANDAAFSAAYAIASCCESIFCTATGGVGSIGVVCQHVDYSKAEEKAGIKVTSIFAGAKKADLSPHAPLSDEAAADLQAEVNRLYEMFVSLVAKNRGLSTDTIKATEAKTYFGIEAQRVGLVDGITDLKSFLYQQRGNQMESEEKSVEVAACSESSEAERSEVELYREKVLAITKLCRIAKSERLAEFLERDLDVEFVKAELLKDAQKSEDIENSPARMTVENPLIKMARKLKEGRK